MKIIKIDEIKFHYYRKMIFGHKTLNSKLCLEILERSKIE